MDTLNISPSMLSYFELRNYLLLLKAPPGGNTTRSTESIQTDTKHKKTRSSQMPIVVHSCLSQIEHSLELEWHSLAGRAAARAHHRVMATLAGFITYVTNIKGRCKFFGAKQLFSNKKLTPHSHSTGVRQQTQLML